MRRRRRRRHARLLLFARGIEVELLLSPKLFVVDVYWRSDVDSLARWSGVLLGKMYKGLLLRRVRCAMMGIWEGLGWTGVDRVAGMGRHKPLLLLLLLLLALLKSICATKAVLLLQVPTSVAGVVVVLVIVVFASASSINIGRSFRCHRYVEDGLREPRIVE